MAEDMGITPPVQARTHNHHGTHGRTTAHACTHIGTQAHARARGHSLRHARTGAAGEGLHCEHGARVRRGAAARYCGEHHTIKPTPIDPRGRVPRSTAACPRDRRGTVQRGTAQRGTAQRGTAQRGSVPRQRTLCGFSGACPLGPRFYFVSTLDRIRSSSTARQSP